MGQNREANTLLCSSHVGGSSWAGEGMGSGLGHQHPAAVPGEAGELPNRMHMGILLSWDWPLNLRSYRVVVLDCSRKKLG